MEQASIRTRLEQESVAVLPPDDNDDDDQHDAAESAQVEQIHEEGLDKLSAPWAEELRASRARQEDLLDQIVVSLCAFSSSTCPFLSCIYLDLTLNPIITCYQRLNGAFTASRRTEGDGGRSSPEREAAIQKFELAAAKYDEMQHNLHEGLKFYADLSRLLGELRDAVKDVSCPLPPFCDRFARGSFPRSIARLGVAVVYADNDPPLPQSCSLSRREKPTRMRG